MYDLTKVLDPLNGYVDEFVSNKERLYDVQLTNGNVKILGKWLLINLIFWKPIIKRGLPIKPEYRFTEDMYTNKQQQRIHSVMLEDLLVIDSSDKFNILKEMLESLNILYNAQCTHMGDHIKSISMFSMAETLEHPEIAEACFININNEIKNKDIKHAEKKLQQQASNIMKTLSDKKLKRYNNLYPYVALGLVSSQQLPQVLGSAGTRTDINDMMILMPVTSSYMQGLGSSMEVAIDSLSAKKSLLYNKSGLGDSQYAHRLEQLMTSCLYKLHNGDCGTKVYLPFEILEHNVSKCIGKYIVENESLIELTKLNLNSYIGKTVEMRSPIGCRHTNGACHACCGKMAEYIMPNTVIGIASTIEVMGPLAQLILSNKHVSKTNSMEYNLSSELSSLFEYGLNGITFKQKYINKLKGCVLGVPFIDAVRLQDLQYVGKVINDQHFSNITQVSIMNKKTDDYLLADSILVDSNHNVPYFSPDFLKYLRNNPEAINYTIDTVWLDLDKFDMTKPVFKCVIANASTLKFAKEIRNFFRTNISTYTSGSEVMNYITNVIYEKISPNILHLEVMIKASLITNEQDFRIPIVADMDNLMFGKLGQLIDGRSIGGQLAYQQQGRYFSDPNTFTVPKQRGIFDALVGL